MIPSTKTAVKANCQEYPIPKQTENAKNALIPIPAESAKGRFATRLMTKQATAEEIAVAEKTFENSIPVAERIPGLTARM